MSLKGESHNAPSFSDLHDSVSVGMYGLEENAAVIILGTQRKVS